MWVLATGYQCALRQGPRSPLTIGLQQWNLRATGINATPIYNLVIAGSLLAIVPIVAIFLSLQRYWQSGLAAGSVKA